MKNARWLDFSEERVDTRGAGQIQSPKRNALRCIRNQRASVRHITARRANHSIAARQELLGQQRSVLSSDSSN